jgi:hypothetical protein
VIAPHLIAARVIRDELREHAGKHGESWVTRSDLEDLRHVAVHLVAAALLPRPWCVGHTRHALARLSLVVARSERGRR